MKEGLYLTAAMTARTERPLAELRLGGHLARETLRGLLRRLDDVHARPRIVDAQGLRSADVAGLADLASWAKRQGIDRVEIINASPALAALVSRYRFSVPLEVHPRTLPIA